MKSLLQNFEKSFEFKTPLIWRNIFIAIVFHLIAFYALIFHAYRTKLITWCFMLVLHVFAGLGVTAGVHRLYAHRAYKAKLPMKIILVFWYLLAGLYSMKQFVRDHRVHHKYTDTDADPHNAKRGFFYSHMGWFLMKRHPLHKEKGKGVDISDVLADPVIQFEEKYYPQLILLVHVLFPTLTAHYLFGENWTISILVVFFLRYCLILHTIWSLNSVTHLWGYKPYNKNIKAVQNKAVAFITIGEGWHNFHHTFPWDYRIAEFGQELQFGAKVIDLFAWFGLAYDLKFASPELIKKVKEKCHPPDYIEEPYPEEQTKEIKSD